MKIDGRIPADYNGSANNLYYFLLKHGYKRVKRLAYKRLIFYSSADTGITHVAYGIDVHRVVDAGGTGDKAMVRIRQFRKTNDLFRILGEK